MDSDETPGSVLIVEILYIELEKDENSLVRLVLIDEKLGLILLDSDERPGPQKIVGYTDEI